MADWRLLYGPLDASGSILGELPVAAMQYQEVLNGVGRWTATCPLDTDPARLNIPGATGPSTPSSSDLGLIDNQTVAVARTRVWFERDGVLLFAGILWTSKADIAANSLELAGEGIGSYWHRRTINATTTFAAVEQLDIARQLIDTAQAAAHGDIGVDTGSGASGVQRDRTWLHYERKTVGEAVEQLAAVDGGFDWAYQTAWSGGAPTVALYTSFPAEGRRTEHVWEVGTNCALLTYSEDGTSVANVVHARGAGDGDDALLLTAQNAALQGPYPILEAVIAHNDVRETATLAAHARRRLTRGAGPLRHVTLDTYPDTVPTLGSYIVGDQVTVRADHGWVQLDDWMRIVDMTVSVEGGAETIRLALAGLEVFTPV